VATDQIAATVFGLTAAGRQIRRSTCYVTQLIDSGLLAPIGERALSTGGLPAREFRVADIRRADRDWRARVTRIRKNGGKKAAATVASRGDRGYPGSETTQEAAQRLGLSDDQILYLVANHGLQPLCGGRGFAGPYRYWPDEVDAAVARKEAKEKESRTGQQLHTAAARKKWREKIDEKLSLPGLSAAQAGRRVGVDEEIIRTRHSKGKLRAICECPLRFSEADVDGQFPPVIGKGEITVASISHRISATKADRRKLTRRVWNVIHAHGIETFARRAHNSAGIVQTQKCIREEVVSEILDRFEVDPPRADEITQEQAEKEFQASWRKTIQPAVDEFAPEAARRRSRFVRRGRIEFTVYPRAAIEAALRGERWETDAESIAETPPPTTGQLPTMPGFASKKLVDPIGPEQYDEPVTIIVNGPADVQHNAPSEVHLNDKSTVIPSDLVRSPRVTLDSEDVRILTAVQNFDGRPTLKQLAAACDDDQSGAFKRKLSSLRDRGLLKNDGRRSPGYYLTEAAKLLLASL